MRKLFSALIASAVIAVPLFISAPAANADTGSCVLDSDSLNQTAVAGQLFVNSLRLSSTDGSSCAFESWSSSGLPSYLSLSNSGNLSGTFPSDTANTYVFVPVTWTKGGVSTSGTVSITVSPDPNAAPATPTASPTTGAGSSGSNVTPTSVVVQPLIDALQVFMSHLWLLVSVVGGGILTLFVGSILWFRFGPGMLSKVSGAYTKDEIAQWEKYFDRGGNKDLDEYWAWKDERALKKAEILSREKK